MIISNGGLFILSEEERNWSIYQIEEFYCNRMEYLVDLERFEDSHAIFEEFVVDNQEPEEYYFLTFHREL
jgi:hypothetical protein